MNYGLESTFPPNEVRGTELKKIFDYCRVFTPITFVNKYKTYEWNELKFTKILCKNEGGTLITASNYDTREAFTSGGAMLNNFQSLTIILNKEKFNLSIIDKIISSYNFVNCYLYNEDYVTQQSAYNSSIYEVHGLHISLAKDLPYTIDGTRVKTFDISKNYGRASITRKTWLIATWKMWFGKPFFELVSKERLLSFPFALEIKELENERVYIQLFEKVEESSKPENREKQRLFREWCDFDGLIKKYI